MHTICRQSLLTTQNWLIRLMMAVPQRARASAPARQEGAASCRVATHTTLNELSEPPGASGLERCCHVRLLTVLHCQHIERIDSTSPINW